MEWIKISDRKPADGEDVLMCSILRHEIWIGYRVEQGGYSLYHEKETEQMREPAYWMPLPTLPK